MQLINNFLADFNLSNDLETLIKFLFFTFVILVALRLTKSLIHQKVKTFAQITKNDFDDLVIKILDGFGVAFYLTLSAFLSLEIIDFQDRYSSIIENFVFVLMTYYIIKSLTTISSYLFKKLLKDQKAKYDDFDPTIIKVLNTAVKSILWILGLLFLLQNFNYSISAILGGIGVVGIAIAFALQSVLKNVFAFFSIYFDKPFKVGDFIVLNDKQSGTVKKIGIRSTRIKTLRGEELVISNEDLTNARVQNFKKLTERRVSIDFQVTYDTPAKKLEKINSWVQEIVEAQEQTRFSRSHLRDLSEFSIIFEFVYFVENSDYNIHMDIKQAINLALIKKLEKEGVSFAYPTKTIHVKQ